MFAGSRAAVKVPANAAVIRVLAFAGETMVGNNGMHLAGCDREHDDVHTAEDL